MTELTPQEEAEIRARLAKVTPWPWVYIGEPEDHAFWGEIHSAAEDGSFAHIADTPEYDERGDDMEFIAHAPEDISRLLETIAVLREENEHLRHVNNAMDICDLCDACISSNGGGLSVCGECHNEVVDDLAAKVEAVREGEAGKE